jgi:hypothetical protein
MGTPIREPWYTRSLDEIGVRRRLVGGERGLRGAVF